MQRLIDNPYPTDTEIPFNTFDDILQAIEQEFDNEWENYARIGRENKLRYPHVTIYDKEGELNSRDNIFYRLVNCEVQNLFLAKNDSFVINGGRVRKVLNGSGGSHIIMRESQVFELNNVQKAFLKLIDCDTTQLKIRNCKDCIISIINSSTLGNDPFLSNCESVLLRLNRFTYNGSQTFSQGNKNCHFVTDDCQISTSLYSFADGTGNFAKFERTSFLGNEWVYSQEQDHSAHFNECTVACIHGFRGGGLNLVFTGGDIQAAKTFAGSNNKIAILGAIVGGEKTFWLSDSLVMGLNATISSPDYNALSSNTTFAFINSSVTSSETNFKSSNDKIYMDNGSLKATQTNVDGEATFKARNVTIQADETNFKGSGSIVLSNCGSVQSSNVNVDGGYKYIGLESTTMTASNDSLKGSFGEAIIRNSTVTSPHPLKCSIDKCLFTNSSFEGHSILNATQSDFFNVKFGQVDMTLNLTQQVETTFGSPANFTKLCGRSSNCKFQGPTNISQANMEFGCCKFEDTLNIGDGRVTFDDVNILSTVTITGNVVANKLDVASNMTVSGSFFATEISVSGNLAVTGGMNLNDVSASSLALVGSGALNNVSGGGSVEGCFVATNTNISGGGATVLSGGGVVIGTDVPKGQIIRSGELSCILYGSQCACCPGGCHSI